MTTWTWEMSPLGPRALVGDDGTRLELPGVGDVEYEARRGEPTVMTVRPIPGQERECHESVRELVRVGLDVRVADPELAVFFGGPWHGRAHPVPAGSRPPDHWCVPDDPLSVMRAEPAGTAADVTLNVTRYRLRGPFGDRWLYVAEGAEPPPGPHLHFEERSRGFAAARERAARVRAQRTEAELWRQIAAHRAMAATQTAEAFGVPEDMLGNPRNPMDCPSPLTWRACAGSSRDPHDEVRWQGGEECWMCGQPGAATHAPRVNDQDVAPYGWG